MYQKGLDAYRQQKYEYALGLFEKASEAGIVEAQFYCGVIYDTGKGRPINTEKAYTWYRKAAEAGYVNAQFNCGVMHYHGRGVAQDYEKAFYWFRRAAEGGYAKAQYQCGLLYEGGHGTKKNLNEAIHWYKKASAQGYEKAIEYYKTAQKVWEERRVSIEAAHTKAPAMYKAGDYKGAFQCFLAAAYIGDDIARYNCALMYLKGEGVETNPEKAINLLNVLVEKGNEKAIRLNKAAVEMLQKMKEHEAEAKLEDGYVRYEAGDYAGALSLWLESAKSGNAEAQLNCGILFDQGNGAEHNPEKAFYWYERAAEQNDAEAQYQCGMMYEEGEGTAQSSEYAEYWLEKAAEQGHEKAKEQLPEVKAKNKPPIPGINFYDVSPDSVLQQAKQGDPAAQYLYGEMCADGQNVKKDLEQARFWLKKSAAQDIAPAKMLLLSIDRREMKKCARDGLTAYRMEDYEHAFQLFLKAAEAGEQEAQYYCGLMCHDGVGTRRDTRKAHVWYGKAAEQGHNSARICYAMTLAKGDGCLKDVAAGREWLRRVMEDAAPEDAVYKEAEEKLRSLSTM